MPPPLPGDGSGGGSGDGAISPAEPVLLLKTKSTPADAYEELFTSPDAAPGRRFNPRFVPVFEHRLEASGLAKVRAILREGRVSSTQDGGFGGLIFTSQRAVEAFAELLREGAAANPPWPHLQDVPVYSVGPATTRALRSIPHEPSLQVVGEHTGNGQALAAFILGHYREWYPYRPTKPPLLFLVGERRRDIIPKTLMSDALGPEWRIEVAEEVVYDTVVMESFRADFDRVLEETQHCPRRWVVVYSPTGCDSMLRSLGMLDRDQAKLTPGRSRDNKTFIATIGPTTRDYLRTTFDLEPDVCAEKPTPKALLDGIVSFEPGRS